ncbi:MAG: DNA repair protein RecO [Proteobacteria bacterium]|nr:DNA repair protein RecO [Pseudomonadota bacterium]
MKRSTESIILRRVAYRDADWIVTFFSRDSGRQSGIARSARLSRRRFGGSLEPGSVVEIGYSECRGRGLLSLDRSSLLVPLNGILKSLERIGALSRSLALALAFLQENEANAEKFDLLRARIERLAECDPRPIESAAFELRWLGLCGYAPSIGVCTACGAPAQGAGAWSFDFDKGGLACGSCRRGGRSVELSAAARRGLCSLLDGGGCPDDASAEAALSVMGRYVDHVLGRPLGVI